ncbi:MAG: DUF3667 domain-containing protein [Terricaulis sp.]
MSGELEAAGAAATAGLVAGAIEGREAHGREGGACANCGAVLQGHYCHICGQPAHVHRSLSHLVEETLHGLFHFDTKTWRTLPKLAFRPGTLTRDYIDGKRASYVSPLALFLFTVFLMFATMAAVGGISLTDVAHVEVNGTAVTNAETRETALADLQRDRAEAVASGDTEAVEALDNVINVIRVTTPADEAGEAGGHGGPLAEMIRQGVRDGRITSNNPKVMERLENPELLFYKVEQAAYKFAFLLIPISLPFIALLFLWKRGVTWFDHAVFALYSLSFMSLLFLVLALLSPWAHEFLPLRIARGVGVMVVPPVHMFFQLGGAYKLGWFSALWRTFALLTICGIAFFIFLGLIVMVGFLG